MSRLVTLLSLIESGAPGHFDRDVPTIMLPQPLPERSAAIVLPAHPVSLTCICAQCEHVWDR